MLLRGAPLYNHMQKADFLYFEVEASLEIAGAKEQICACWVVKCSWFSNKFVHKEMNQEQFSGNFQ